MLSILSSRNAASFILGFVTCFVVTLVIRYTTVHTSDHHIFSPVSPHSSEKFRKHQFEHAFELNEKQLILDDKHSASHDDEDIVAKSLYKKVRIFCWIMTLKSSHENRARHVKETWAKRCNNFIFISDFNDPTLPSINVNVTIGRDHLWQKTKNAFQYIYKHHLNDYDYFLATHDDTFVILENLRHMVKSLNPLEPFYMGRRFRLHVKQGYMSGDSGYLLSKGALKKLIEKGLNLNKCPPGEGGAEDVNIGQCLETIGVRINDSLDEEKRERFHPLVPTDMLIEKHMKNIPWMFSYNYHKLKFGTECCSDDSVTFHYVAPHEMYMMEYFIYHLRPYGIVRDYHEIKDIINTLDTRKQILKSSATNHS